jgi:hypothetical protein
MPELSEKQIPKMPDVPEKQPSDLHLPKSNPIQEKTRTVEPVEVKPPPVQVSQPSQDSPKDVQKDTSKDVPKDAPKDTPKTLVSLPSADRKTVQDIQWVNTSENAFEMIIAADGPITSYRHFYLFEDNILKLVIDIQGKWNIKHKTYPAESAMVHRVRTGAHPDYIRVVLDLKGNDRIPPVFAEETNGLRVSIRR